MKPIQNSTSGLALIASMAFMFMAVSLLTLGWTRAFGHHKETDLFVAYEAAAHTADWMILKVEVELESRLNAQGTAQFQPDPQEVATATNPVTFAWAEVIYWDADGIDNNGNGQVDEATEKGAFSIIGYIRCNRVKHGVEAVFRAKRVAGKVNLEATTWKQVPWKSPI